MNSSYNVIREVGRAYIPLRIAIGSKESPLAETVGRVL